VFRLHERRARSFSTAMLVSIYSQWCHILNATKAIPQDVRPCVNSASLYKSLLHLDTVRPLFVRHVQVAQHGLLPTYASDCLSA
jgi:hypothetical protein